MSHPLIAYAENFASLFFKINFAHGSIFEFAEFILRFQEQNSVSRFSGR